MECAICEQNFDEEEMIQIEKGEEIIYLCRSCAEKLEERGDLVYCRDCEIGLLREYASRYTDDEYICDYCRERNYVSCDDCGELLHRDQDNYYVDEGGTLYCEVCSESYAICENCGYWVYIDDVIVDNDYYYCESCWHALNNTIRDHSYKPDFVFYSFQNEKENLYLGVELEIDDGGEDAENAKEILKEGEDFIYIKHDGSLSAGLEIVSHPATLFYHLIKVNWGGILQKAKKLGYTSHDNERCGLHIHINRSFWGNCYFLRDFGKK
jgi:hypothetical protein